MALGGSHVVAPEVEEENVSDGAVLGVDKGVLDDGRSVVEGKVSSEARREGGVVGGGDYGEGRNDLTASITAFSWLISFARIVIVKDLRPYLINMYLFQLFRIAKEKITFMISSFKSPLNLRRKRKSIKK